MLESRLRSYFWWKGVIGKMSRHMKSGSKGSHASSNAEDQESAALKRKREWRKTQAPSYKRRRVRGGGSTGSNGSRTGEDEKGADALQSEADKLASVYVTLFRTSILVQYLLWADVRLTEPAEKDPQDNFEEEQELDESLFEEYFGLIPTDDLLVIRSYEGDDDDRVLQELLPKYVIMYDADPAFIRRVEVCVPFTRQVLRKVHSLQVHRRPIKRHIVITPCEFIS